MRWVTDSGVQTPDDVQRLLGVGLNSEQLILRRAYDKAVSANPELRPDLRLAFKISDDPYYRAAFQNYGSLEAVAKAGFFDDGLEPGRLLDLMNPNWLVTPLDKLLYQIDQLKYKPPQDNPRVVLLTTGCFAPVHEGHLAMMDAGWSRLSQEGYAVLGGFFSSSHDIYVSTKGSDAASLNADVRMRALNKALAPYDWLMADPWESLYVPCSVNFTDVIRRLKMYINRHVTSHPPVEVAYVFGSDNAQFARAFTREGLAVCVERPGYEDGIKLIKDDPVLSANGRVLFTDSKADGQFTPKVSSTAVRLGTHPVLSTIAQEMNDHQLEIVAARSQSYVTPSDKAVIPAAYLVRDDVRWGARIWEDLCERGKLTEACDTFTQGLVSAIERAFERSRTPGYPSHIDPVLMQTAMQRVAAAEVCERHNVVNNDVITIENGMPAGVSRLFSLSSPQFRPGELVERPENVGSLSRLAQLRPGSYVLMDDDIATGTTMKALKAIMPSGCEVQDELALSKIAFERQFPGRKYEFWDVIDARDFLMGVHAGGLVVRLFNEQIARAPYIAPYTSLSSRANIPPGQERDLSLDITRLNIDFFKSVGEKITLRLTAQPFQNLMASAGFGPDDPMLKIVTWHANKLALK